MMRTEVCIVLNEREPAKAKAAELLQAKLAEYNITASRLIIDEHVEKLLYTRAPRVAVLDYLIGDYSTGLDLMGMFLDLPPVSRPKFIFLTDEPSLPVAVEAMRLGAADYLELDHPQSIQKAAESIRALLERTESSGAAPPPLKLTELTAIAASSAGLIDQARVLAVKPAPVILIHGPAGAGVSTLARALALEKFRRSHCVTVSWPTFDRELAGFCGLESGAAPGLRLGRDLSLLIDDADEEEGELLSFLAGNFSRIWDSPAAQSDSAVIVCLHSGESLRLWKHALPAEELKVPGLDRRIDDIPVLAQHFAHEAAALLDKNIKIIDGEIPAWLSGQDWPGNMRELRAVTIDSAVRSSFSRQKALPLMIETKELWESMHAPAPAAPPPDAYAAAAVLADSGGNFRIAASRLGCSIRGLKQILAAAAQTSPSRTEHPL